MSTQHPTLYVHEKYLDGEWADAGHRDVTAWLVVSENSGCVPYVPASALDDLRAEVEALRRERATLTARAEKAEADRAAAVSRAAALEAAAVGSDGYCVLCRMGVRHGARHTQSCALSGGTAALDAHDAALREEIAREVEGVTRYAPRTSDFIEEAIEPDSEGEYLDRTDVLAAIEGGK